MPKGNKNPIQTEEFLAAQFRADDLPEGEVMATKKLTVRLPEKLDAYVRSRPKMSAWVRKALAEAMERDLKTVADK